MNKTIIFDLGGVVFTDGAKIAISSISEKYNIPRINVRNVILGDLGTQYRIGKITVEEFRNKAKTFWERPEIDTNDLSNIRLSSYKKKPKTFAVIKLLQKDLDELLYLSDNVKERVEYLENKYHFQKLFKGGIFSHVLKTRKPDPKMYEEIFKLTKNKAEDCIYIDDKEELLEPAKKLGMNVIHFKTAEQLEQALKEFGLLQ